MRNHSGSCCCFYGSWLPIWTLFVLVGGLLAQGGRFEPQKRAGFDYLKSGKFDLAAGKLEEVWDFEQNDPMVAEGLSIAYLNGADRRQNTSVEARAYAILQKSMADGGKAVFLVVHSHEKLAALQGHDIINFCPGRLEIAQGKLAYVADQGTHSFELKAADIRDVGGNFGWGRGMFHIKTNAKEAYILAPRSRAEQDSKCLLELISRYVSAPK